ncbi:MAG: molybdopterin-dependent oxidoreductase [Gemmatimonadetes bacterium]|nr:molybdopterin-dependent oxidoreductase [Gemmatimonadota bacterium]
MSNGPNRREFLKVLGVTGAGAGLTGCGTGGAERLIPYVTPAEEIVPGTSTWYRTTCRECPAGCGMNIRTREGRAVKAEGNPLSPISHGRLCARGQASLHGLYDPDRVPRPLARKGEDDWNPVSWDDAERQLADQLQQNRGRTVLLSGNYTGTMDVLADQFAASLGIERLSWEPFGYEPLRAANRMVFGVDAVPVNDFRNADVVISFGADFLETWLSPVDYAHSWVQSHAYSQGRKGHMVWVGPHQSLTGLNADEWLPVRPGTEHLAALAIARLIADAGGNAGSAAATIANVDVANAAQRTGVSVDRFRQVARIFAANGRSLAVGPGVASTHAAATAVAAAVAILNQVAGNIGSTVRLENREEHAAGTASYADMQRLLQRMQQGEIGALLVHGPNPLYNMPENDVVEAALAAVPFIASFSPMLDETSSKAHLLLPDHHFLESWGDFVPRTGVTALVQPVMTPVFQSKQTGDVMLSVARRLNAPITTQANTYYDFLRERWARDIMPGSGIAGGFEDAWREALKVGYVQSTAPAAPATAAASTPDSAAGMLASMNVMEAAFTGEAGDDSYYLIAYPSYRFFDGRLANRAWLQELPDPISKFCWSSWVEINPATADRLRIDNGHIIEVTTSRGTMSLPAWRHPGTREDTIAIQMGQGHEGLGRYAHDRGVNVMRLLEPAADPLSGALVTAQLRATIHNTRKWERPIQAGLHSDQDGRQIARNITLEDARHRDEERGFALLPITAGPQVTPRGEHPVRAPGDYGRGVGVHVEPDVHPFDARVKNLQGSAGWSPTDVDASPMGWPPPGTHYGEYSEAQPRWAMAIDLERCIGCSACTTACYAENNIGIVGPEQVAKGRILHWIRIERYFEGEGENLETQFLPMMCQHCGTAPCEPVCPVYAAYHTPDGLNAQVYNRCVGTRYCANNCPYKVRVFNWYSYEWPEPLNWQLNPDVTVREKGVMEKCTFCVQRIRDAENTARLEDRGARDGEVTPACAQTCPGDALVFGNIKDPNSRVARVAASGRGYRVFEGINTQSAITYLKKVSIHAETASAPEAH